MSQPRTNPRGPTDSPPGGNQPPGKRPKALDEGSKKPPQFTQMVRPGYGIKGKEVKLLCNHFQVTLTPHLPVVHYSVSVKLPSLEGDNKAVKSNVNRRVVAQLCATYKVLRENRFVYDGEHTLFVVGELEFRSKEFKVLLPDQRGRNPRDNDRGNEFLVKIDYAASVDMKAIATVNRGEFDVKAQDALRVLDIMLREHATKNSYILQRDSFYSRSFGKGMNLSDGIETWKGFHASFRTTQGGLSLNFDTATTIMIKESSVEQFVQEFCKKDIKRFGNEDFIKCKRILKGVQVETYLKQKHKVNGFSPQGCDTQLFPMRRRNTGGDLQDPEEITVAEYFMQVRGMQLKNPSQRALDVGNSKKPMYLPMEHCTIVPGQRYKRTLNTFQRQGMIRECKLDPQRRVELIDKMMVANKYKEDELLREFNVQIAPEKTELIGRVLDAPELQFGKSHREVPRGGRWNFSMDRQMNKPANIGRWIVVCFRNSRPVDARRIAEEMMTNARKKGMQFGQYLIFEEENNDHFRKSPQQRVEAMIEKLRRTVINDEGKPCSGEKWPFVLAILPEKSPDLYIPFKRTCETQIGIVTQCIVPPGGKVNPKYLSSVTLKINLKWGGYNSLLTNEEKRTLPKISQVPTIILGLDVSHGSPGDANSPSVAAAVGTVDWPKFSKYTCSIRAQNPKLEIIDGLREAEKSGMVRELLMNFHNFGGPEIPASWRKPQQILVYRDGVSESQFEQVMESELLAIKKACRDMEADYNPKVTFLVVQKRHHTRFFPASRNGAASGNVAPGTVVDRTVCHPRDNDFYLISHAAIGTSRPTHYHVLYDEIGFSADELQMITNGLCYTYSRCTSAVSVAAPVYYAHVAAAHCRNFVDSSGTGSDSTLGTTHLQQAKDLLPKLSPLVLKKMFYA